MVARAQVNEAVVGLRDGMWPLARTVHSLRERHPGDALEGCSCSGWWQRFCLLVTVSSTTQKYKHCNLARTSIDNALSAIAMCPNTNSHSIAPPLHPLFKLPLAQCRVPRVGWVWKLGIGDSNVAPQYNLKLLGSSLHHSLWAYINMGHDYTQWAYTDLRQDGLVYKRCNTMHTR